MSTSNCQGFLSDFLSVTMDLVLKRPWFGLVVFFGIAMVLLESGDACIGDVKLNPDSMIRMVQVIMVKGNILQNMVEKAMKKGDNSKMIKGIKGLKITDLAIPGTFIVLKPDDVAEMKVNINITVAGKSFIGGDMKITVFGEMYAVVTISKSPSGKLTLKVTLCKVKVISCKTNLPSSMLPKIVNKFLDSTLGKVMPGVLCPAADMMMEKTMLAFEVVLAKKPIGIIGYISYEVSGKPVVYTSYINIHLKIVIEKKNGEMVPLKCDPLPDDLPPRKEKMSAVYLPASALNGVLLLIQPLLNTVLTKVKGSVPTSDQLKKILPNVGLPAGKKMKIQISHTGSPTVSVSASASSLTTYIEASFLDVKGGKKLLSIKMKHECSMVLVTEKEHLAINLKAGSCKTVELSSPGGDVTAATKYTETIMEHHVTHCNGVFNKNQVPLPSIMNATSTTHDAQLQFADNLLIFHGDIQPYGTDEMAREVKKQCKTLKL